MALFGSSKRAEAEDRWDGFGGGSLSAAGRGDASIQRGLSRPLNFGSPLEESDLLAVQDLLGISAAELWTVINVETIGCGFLPSKRPVVRFERHWFSKLTDGDYDKRYPEISNRRRGTGHGTVYERLNMAIDLDETAALESTSWGLGQVMGFNAEIAGFSSAQDMVADMERSEGAQLWAMANFIKHKGLDEALRNHQWADFARTYNGSSYRENQYDTRLASAYAGLKARNAPDLQVRSTQMCLRYLGYDPRGVDGLIGNGTRDALNSFQRDASLKETQEIDDKTFSYLQVNADRLARGNGSVAVASSGFVASDTISIEEISGKSGGGTVVGTALAAAGIGVDEVGVMVLDVAEDVVSDDSAAGDTSAVPEEPPVAVTAEDTPPDEAVTATPTPVPAEPETVEADEPVTVEAGTAEPEPVEPGAAETVTPEPSASVEDAPLEPAPVETVPLEEAPLEEAPVEEAPVEDTPVPTAPVEEPGADAPVVVDAADPSQAPVEETISVVPADPVSDGAGEAGSGFMDIVGWFLDTKVGGEVRSLIRTWLEEENSLLLSAARFVLDNPSSHYIFRGLIYLLLAYVLFKTWRSYANRASLKRFLRKSVRKRGGITGLLRGRLGG